MSSSLEELSSYLKEYKIIINEFMPLERGKINQGDFPHEYLDSWETLNETELPDKRRILQ